MSLCKANNIVIGSAAVTNLFYAFQAPVDDHPPFLGVLVYADGLHEAKTERKSVSRTLIIDMFAEEALWAVVPAGPIVQIRYCSRAVFTDKWFLNRYENHGSVCEPEM